jgi:integrase
MGLTVKTVEKIIREGKAGATADGDGLYLRITPQGSSSWQFRYTIAGKRRLMGLGGCGDVGLAEARDLAAEARKKLKQGIDPLEAKIQDEATQQAKLVTFEDLARDYIKLHRAGWKNAKHIQQWENTLRDYAFPKFGRKPIQEVDTALVLDALKPIWQEKPETANRVRNRIELVIDSARAQGLYQGSNPAAWRGHLDKLLPKRSRASRAHHAAMDYRKLPEFYEKLQTERDSLSATALALTILTACRTSEVLLADWAEFDLDAALWTIPAERMKAGKVHRVPLSTEAMRLLQSLPQRAGLVFPGQRKDRPLSNMAMTMCLRKLKHTDLTVHGFRSTFRDWAAEETHYANIVAEQALAHVVGNAVEAAYRRGDLLDKRRALMEDWATYCTQKPAANVVSIKEGVAA